MRNTGIAAILAFLIATTVRANDVTDGVNRYADDAKHLALAPLQWDATQWTRFGDAVGVVAVFYAADQKLATDVQRHRTSSTNRVARDITPFGASRALEISTLMVAGGAILRNTTLSEAGRDSLESEIWAAGIVTPLLKRAFGRARPIQERGAHSFHPFSSTYESFPSGHATNVFAFATAIAAHSEGWIVPTIVYSMAAGVAAARVNDRAHFPSDVVAGALIGRAVARGVVALHPHSRTTLNIAPAIVGHRPALVFSLCAAR
ncbi:MAG TPA: phosphatase PAP2 family protein [Thermoanaerobaculia bacterium]|nr:phosphatase PAP2 family protein [Thermoanaerobaculia bacterium]